METRQSGRKMCEKGEEVRIGRRMDRCCHDSPLLDEGERIYHFSRGSRFLRFHVFSLPSKNYIQIFANNIAYRI